MKDKCNFKEGFCMLNKTVFLLFVASFLSVGISSQCVQDQPQIPYLAVEDGQAVVKFANSMADIPKWYIPTKLRGVLLTMCCIETTDRIVPNDTRKTKSSKKTGFFNFLKIKII